MKFDAKEISLLHTLIDTVKAATPELQPWELQTIKRLHRVVDGWNYASTVAALVELHTKYEKDKFDRLDENAKQTPNQIKSLHAYKILSDITSGAMSLNKMIRFDCEKHNFHGVSHDGKCPRCEDEYEDE